MLHPFSEMYHLNKKLFEILRRINPITSCAIDCSSPILIPETQPFSLDYSLYIQKIKREGSSNNKKIT
jgi:hypothetical protein